MFPIGNAEHYIAKIIFSNHILQYTGQQYEDFFVTIVSVALGVGYGLGSNSAVLAQLPESINLIFGGSGIVPAALFAIILNIVLPKDEKTEVEMAEEILADKKAKEK